jgi:hypothetical protein
MGKNIRVNMNQGSEKAKFLDELKKLENIRLVCEKT